MSPQREYTPPEASLKDLQDHLSSLSLSRVVIIQASFYRTDNRCLLNGLAGLEGRARGIAVLPATIHDAELRSMMRQGVSGVRINLQTGNIQDPKAASTALSALAKRVESLGLHIQIYASLGVIAAVAKEIEKLPMPVVLDHFAMPRAELGVSQPGFDAVLALVKARKVYVKLSAPYRISNRAPDYPDVLPIAQALIAAGSSQMLWASDWPHTNSESGKAPTEVSPFRRIDDAAVLKLFAKWVPDAEVRRKILVDNPARLYGF
jgi:predicted TIM-barrel fold metal-dependent hydrolase